jgi:cellobiose phosphorylase
VLEEPSDLSQYSAAIRKVRTAPLYGEAKNSWLTGTAAWNYVAITQSILGIRPSSDGLQTSPVIPSKWQGFKAQRKFRGVTYHIDVRRCGEGNRVSLRIEGKSVPGDIVPLPPSGCTDMKVEVVIGEAAASGAAS